MSKYELREGQWSLFANKDRKTDNHPTHTGTLVLNGVTYKLAAWVKEGKSGRFFSGKAELPSLRETAQAKPAEDINDEIPF